MSEPRRPIHAVGDRVRHGTIRDIDCDGIEVIYLVAQPSGHEVWIYEEDV